MRVSRETATAHRAAVVKAASRLFRRHGIGGVGVAEITRAAGLTHGGFYGHFVSKEALAREALSAGIEESLERLAAAPDLATWVKGYLSRAHRDAPEEGCVIVALSGEAIRSGGEFARIWHDGLEAFIAEIAKRMPETSPATERRRIATNLLALMAGTIGLARATATVSIEASDGLLWAVRGQALAMIGA